MIPFDDGPPLTEAGELLFTLASFVVALVIIGGLSAIVGLGIRAPSSSEERGKWDDN